MAYNTPMILSQIADMEAALATLRDMVVSGTDGTTDAPATKATKACPEPVKATAYPLSTEDLMAMVKAGVKAGAHVKGLAKTVFKAIDLPEEQHAAARIQWKAYRSEIADDDAITEEQEPVLTEEITEALKSVGDYDAKTRTSKLKGELTDYGIHPILHERAGKEWRQWAEENGLGERMKAPKRPSGATKTKKAAMPAVLTEDMIQSIREASDDKGKAFHSGTQTRKLEAVLTGLGIAHDDQKRATKEWKEWAKANGITREGSAAGSKASSVAPEPAAAAASAAAPVPQSAAVPAPKAVEPLTPAMLTRLSDMFAMNSSPGTPDIRRGLKNFGVPKSAWVDAEKQWNEWAKDNHNVTMDASDFEMDFELDEE